MEVKEICPTTALLNKPVRELLTFGVLIISYIKWHGLQGIGSLRPLEKTVNFLQVRAPGLEPTPN